MLKFARNKLVSIERKDNDTLVVHGVLDDDIYGLELNISIKISNLEILSINGAWNRFTTPECPRAIPPLKEAIGLCIEEERFSQSIQKNISRKACRHYANLLLECCHSAKEAVIFCKWEDKKRENPGLTLEEFYENEQKDIPWPTHSQIVIPQQNAAQENEIINKAVKDRVSGGMIIDLHIHTSPASPCSSVPVDLLIGEAKRIGLDGICLTDHNFVWNDDTILDLRQKHDFPILRGNEITTEQGDMIVFGLERDIRGIIKLEELRKEVSDVDGFIIVAHPFRGFLTFDVGQLGLTMEKAMERPLFKFVDAIEVMNGKVTEKENSFAASVATGLGLPAVAGSDAHDIDEVGLYATHFSDFIRDEEDLIEALKNGEYSPIAFRREKG